MSITLTLDQSTLLESSSSWHPDPEMNAHLASLLAADVVRKRNGLTTRALKRKLGRIPSPARIARHLNERPEPNGIVWVCWDDQALAVRTNPTSHTHDRRYVLRWHWKDL